MHGSLLLFAFLTSLRFSAQQQEPTYLYHVCPNTTTYSKNSIFSSNLGFLLSTFRSSNSQSFSSGFYTTAKGQYPDVVYGLFLCRGDVSTEVCRDCVVFAANDIRSLCPDQKESLLWYDVCLLRYADQNFFLESSFQNGTNGIMLYHTPNITSNQNQFSDFVVSTMNQAAAEAANNTRKFIARKANFTAFQSLYVLVQCIPDLRTQDCLSCLQRIINRLPTDKIGGRIIVPSCSSRYELYQFYNEPLITSAPPQLDSTSSPPPPPISILSPPSGLSICFPLIEYQVNTKGVRLTIYLNTGKSENSSVKIIASVVPVTLVFLLLVVVFIVRAKRKKRNSETEPLVVGKKTPF